MIGPSRRANLWSSPARGVLILLVLLGIFGMHGLGGSTAATMQLSGMASPASPASTVPMTASDHASMVPVATGSRLSPRMSCTGHDCLASLRGATNICADSSAATGAQQHPPAASTDRSAVLRPTWRAPPQSVSLTRLGICRT
jgi:hypothetical protein